MGGSLQTDNLYLVGEIKYTGKAAVLYESGSLKAPAEFLLSLQSLMEEYGVVRIDISTDAFKYHSINESK